MIRSRFDREKAVEVLLYITQQCPDMYHALKVLYFADREHLSRYGRTICGDSYVAFRYGPAPSGAYRLIQEARGDSYCRHHDAPQWFAVDDNDITPLREPDTDFLSESDIECLDEAIEKYGPLTFDELHRRSDDEAYRSAGENDFIDFEALVRSLPNGKSLLEYLYAD